MADDCCKLVGNFEKFTGLTGIISVSINSNTDSSLIEDTLIIGQTTSTLSMSAYASHNVHWGCPGRAGVQIPWIKKWDCDNNVVYFIPAGAGRSFISGDVNGLATISREIGSYGIINASAASGPAAIYTDEDQLDGYGLSYNGGPIAIPDSAGFTYDFGGVGVESTFYLQSLNLECNPGNIPTVSYSFVFVGTFPE